MSLTGAVQYESGEVLHCLVEAILEKEFSVHSMVWQGTAITLP